MKKVPPHLKLFFIVLALVSIGTIMIYSASAIIAQERYGDSYFFLKKQLCRVMIGVLLMLFAMNFNYRVLRRIARPLLAVTFLLLILVLTSEFGIRAGGAQRWMRLAFFSFQPAELAKLALILYIADSLVRKQREVSSFLWGFLPPLLILGSFFWLIIRQPDFGTALVLAAVVFIVLFCSGVRIPHLLAFMLGALPCLYILVYRVGYRHQRILAFLNPWQDPMRSGFQIIQSFLALGSGGWKGLGLGNSVQKLFYLPAPHTDFIFAVIGEELGFIGTAGIIILFLGFVWQGIKISLKAPDLFGNLLAVGITSMVGLQASVNLAVVAGLLPTKGICLPFISFGGTSLILNMVGVGILLNISRKSHPEMLRESGP